ncbi:hypothetical protein PNOK_0631700 [Pyrrhoderma noxium]|uniref:Uncharacterized protein n=1 Tax=Pyrrhoderma noxium TaxID=2282107 RepID=A0A286UE11_9AGAM|nr:hypothetical protein PNOK_0631700 [Pyrrhoderma noxium]
MKFVAVLCSLVAAVAAQRAFIGEPQSSDTWTAGHDELVSVVKPDALTGSTEVGIAITLKHCIQNPCEDASEALGSVLYSGPYNPQFGPGMGGQPYQNFTLTIPGGIQSGPAVLSVAHANLIGAGPFFFTEITNTTINIA